MLQAKQVLVVLFAVCAMGNVVASGAFANPSWDIEDHELEPGETSNATGKSTSSFTFHSTSITITCTEASTTGTLTGGAPGTGTAEVTFTGCAVEGKTESECHVNSPGKSVGTLFINAKTELLYIGSKEEAEKESGAIGAMFGPKEGETLATVNVNGTACPAFTKGEQKITGKVIGEGTPVDSESKTGKLNFPTTSIGTAFRLTESGKAEEVKAGLKVLGIVSVTLSGKLSVELTSGKQFGLWRTPEAEVPPVPLFTGNQSKGVFIIFNLPGEYEVQGKEIDQEPGLFSVNEECNGALVTVPGPAESRNCRFEVTVSGYIAGQTGRLKTVWKRKGAIFGRTIYTELKT
jgi:hypothetical protein